MKSQLKKEVMEVIIVKVKMIMIMKKKMITNKSYQIVEKIEQLTIPSIFNVEKNEVQEVLDRELICNIAISGSQIKVSKEEANRQCLS